MSSTARFTSNILPQGSARAADLLNSAQTTRSPRDVVTEMILKLADDDSRLGYNQNITNPQDNDLRYLSNTLQLWDAPLGNDHISNAASLAPVNPYECVVSPGEDTKWKSVHPSIKVTCTTKDAKVTQTLPSVSGHTYLIAVAADINSGIKSFYLTIGSERVLLRTPEPGMWAYHKAQYTGGEITLEPASKDDVNPGDVFYVAVPQLLSKDVDPTVPYWFQTEYVPRWVDCSEVYAMTVSKILKDTTKTIRLHQGQNAPTTGDNWDLWVNTTSIPQLYIWSMGRWSPVTGPELTNVFTEVNKKAHIFYGTDAPTPPPEGFSVGDLWIKDAEETRVWDGQEWRLTTDKSIKNALDAATLRLDETESALEQARQDLYEPGGRVDVVKNTLTGQIDDVAGTANTAQTVSQESAQKAQEAWNKSLETADALDKIAAIVRIDSSRGVLFKSNQIATVLTVSVFRGENVITDILALQAEFGSGAYVEWQWQRMGDPDFGVISSSDSRLSQGGFALTISPADVDEKTVFRAVVNGGS